jgi:hypothetical protein
VEVSCDVRDEIELGTVCEERDVKEDVSVKRLVENEESLEKIPVLNVDKFSGCTEGPQKV